MRRHLFAVACVAVLTQAAASADPDTDAVTGFGLLGDWAPDCRRPPAPSNVYVRFAIVNGKPIRTLWMNGASRVTAMRDVRIAAPDRLVYRLEVPNQGTEQRTIAKVGEAIRSHEVIHADGFTVVENGKLIASGAPTLLYQRCSAQIAAIAESTARA